VLSQVIAARELLAALVALKGLLAGVERAVVTLKVFLAAEAAVAELADEGLGRVLSQGLLATPAVNWSVDGSRGTFGARGDVRVGLGGGILGRILGLNSVSFTGSGSIHDGCHDAGFLLVRLLGTLHLVLVIRASSGGRWAGQSEVESLVVVKAQLLVAEAAAVAKRDNRRSSAGTRTTTIEGVVTTKVDKAVNKVLLRLDIRKILKEGSSGQRRSEVESGLNRSSEC
jgi:hypothetical protein